MIKPFDEIQWLGNFFDNAVNFDVDSIDRVRNFVFLWNLFETFACDRDANIGTIDKAVKNLNLIEPISSETYKPYVDYFSKRYFNPNGDTDLSVDGLGFKNRGKDLDAKKKVVAVLKREEADPEAVLKALLYILYRLRNNLFHGNKSVISLNTQVDNFIAANKILSIIMAAMKRNGMTMIRL